jgi:hypothetical protein
MDQDLEALTELCAEVGVAFGALSGDVRQRLCLLAEHSETVRDARRIIRLARAVFDHYARTHPDRAFDAIEQHVVLIGSLFSDIGKTGPPHAALPSQRLIVEMFSVEGVRDDQQPVARFLRDHFPHDAEDRVRRFEALGLDATMPMRAFWNLHAGWTLAIARAGGLPREAVAAAATHHLLEDINPEDIVQEDGRFSVDFGENVAFDRAEKLVIVLDKYDALLRRGRHVHEEAVAWIRRLIARHPRYGSDAEFEELLEALDVVGRATDTLPASERLAWGSSG